MPRVLQLFSAGGTRFSKQKFSHLLTKQRGGADFDEINGIILQIQNISY